MTTLADAIRADFDRRHPRGKNTLLCVGLCRRRKDREEFRETPWHGRAASCLDCEGRRYSTVVNERAHWQLQQERERVRALRRLVSHQRIKLLLRPAVASAADAALQGLTVKTRWGRDD